MTKQSDNLSRLHDLAAKLDRNVPLAGMINPDAYTCRYAAEELEMRRAEVERMCPDYLRYQWLKKNLNESGDGFSELAFDIAQGKPKEDWDAAIDAQIERELL